MSYVKFSSADYKNELKTERKLARNKFYTRKKAVDTSNGIAHHKYFYVFLFGGIFGCIWEEILLMLMHGFWDPRSGVFWLNFNPLYGFGALGFVLVLSRFDKWYHQITYGAIVGGAVEYFAHLFQELATGTRSWNYTAKITNIDGRTTVIYAIFWGLLGFLLVRFLYPLIIKLLKKIPYRIGEIVTTFLKFTIFSVIIISYTAVIRYYLASNGYEPLTIYGELCDKYFTKDYIKKYYRNMKFK